MKKFKPICLLTILMLLGSCGGNNSSVNASSTSESSTERISSVIEESSLSSEEISSSTYDPYSVISLTEREIPIYSVSKNPDEESMIYQQKSTIKFYRVNNSSIPYIDLSYFVSNFLYGDELTTSYVFQGANENALVYNPTNNTGLSFNFSTREVIYNGYMDFFTNVTGFDRHFYGSVYGSSYLNDLLTTYENEIGNETIALNLADYNINLFIANGKYFLP